MSLPLILAVVVSAALLYAKARAKPTPTLNLGQPSFDFMPGPSTSEDPEE